MFNCHRIKERIRKRRSMSLQYQPGSKYMIWGWRINHLIRVGKKRKRVKGPDAANKLPGVTPHTKVMLRRL